jgi:parallel beta-helix repeat protein
MKRATFPLVAVALFLLASSSVLVPLVAQTGTVRTRTRGRICASPPCTFSVAAGHRFTGTTNPSHNGDRVLFTYKQMGARRWRSFGDPGSDAAFIVPDGRSFDKLRRHRWTKRFQIGPSAAQGTQWVLRALFPSQAGLRQSSARVRVTMDCVALGSGEDLGEAVSRNPDGTRFCLLGEFVVTSPIRPKPGNQFIGPAVITPEGSVDQGFSAHGVPDVAFVELDMSGFELRAIQPGPNGVVSGSFLHHNGRNGLGCGECDNILVEDNEIAFNGSEEHLGDGSAGIKSVANFVTIRRNEIHDNLGNGIWFDVDARSQLIEHNHVYRNTRKGIFFEISDGGIVRYNTVQRNNCAVVISGCTPLHDASGGIATNSSRNIEIYGNVLGGNAEAGINFRDDSRAYAPPFNIRVYANVLNGDIIKNCHSVWDIVCYDND